MRLLCALAALLLAHGACAKGVHAFYYLWYGTPEHDAGEYLHWNHRVLDHWDHRVRARFPADVQYQPPNDLHSGFYPEKGPYSSRDPLLLARHMEEMRGAGIDTAVVSWWGRPDVPDTSDTQGVSTDAAVAEVLAAAEAAGVRVAFHLEPYRGRSAASVRADVEYLQRQYGDSPALLRLGPSALPVFYVYDSYHVPPGDWREMLSGLRGTANDGVFLGLWLYDHHGKELLAGGFDGGYTYFATQDFSYGSTLRNWRKMAAWSAANSFLFVPSVAPGYNDLRIRPWNAHSQRVRNGGEYYDTMWEAALAVEPEVVSITSFNEWGEGTQIEAAVPFQPPKAPLHRVLRDELDVPVGYDDYLPHAPDFYLEKTRQWAAEFLREEEEDL